jgi:hypothetical protein
VKGKKVEYIRDESDHDGDDEEAPEPPTKKVKKNDSRTQSDGIPNRSKDRIAKNKPKGKKKPKATATTSSSILNTSKKLPLPRYGPKAKKAGQVSSESILNAFRI